MDINDIIKLSVDQCISIYKEMAAGIHKKDESGHVYGLVSKKFIIKYGMLCIEPLSIHYIPVS